MAHQRGAALCGRAVFLCPPAPRLKMKNPRLLSGGSSRENWGKRWKRGVLV